jgi:hypothetical protein
MQHLPILLASACTDDGRRAMNSLSVSGPSIYYSNVTCNSSLNVIGNIIGSGTALTNLNYNAITNKPDLTQYATNTNLNNVHLHMSILSRQGRLGPTPDRVCPGQPRLVLNGAPIRIEA